ncbi:hypothetical protein ACT3SP_13320 [Brachybacterium sp. AOP43-C2-M15]|uniref:hypothetical protein n=1 Tax=Brachybacterium sp. AOP43-C2-M15 TaxID=3457661 RepID=UPI004034B8F1
MRFERIFDDLEGQFAHQQQEEMRAVSEELTRAERAQLTLADRLRGAGDDPLTLHLGPSLRATGRVEEVGVAWVSLRERRGGGRSVIPLAAVALVEGLPGRARPAEESPISSRSLGSVLREIARDRSVVRLETTAGSVVGRLAAVGADAMDVRSLPTGEQTAVPGTARITVAMTALLAVLPR